DQDPRELYEQMKADQGVVAGRTLTCYLVAFKEGEALRPSTPVSFFKELTMFSPKFSEGLQRGDDGKIISTYRVTIPCKDANFGRSNVPGGTYADTVQKRRAAERGVAVGRGA